MHNVALLLPSRGRPGNFYRLLQAFSDFPGDFDIFLRLDDDDPTAPQYLANFGLLKNVCYLRTGPRKPLGELLNDLLKDALREWSYQAIMVMGDDQVPRTAKWSEELVASATGAGDLGLAYPNDLLQGPRLATMIVGTRSFFERLGYVAPPGFAHQFIDNALMDIAGELGCLHYREDIVVEHMHPGAGKAQMDATYERQSDFDDESTYRDWCLSGKPLGLMRVASEMLPVVCAFTSLRPETLESLESLGRRIQMAYVGDRDNAYCDLLRALWKDGRGFVLVEHDVFFTPEQFEEIANCEHDWCGANTPYGNSVYPGLGLAKFSPALLARTPDAMEQVALIEDDTHPKEHWCRLDAWLQWRVLPTLGETRHIHDMTIGHTHTQPSHGCCVIS